MSYKKQLTTLGLTEKEAVVYEALLVLGPSTITTIFSEAKLKKGDTYNVLRGLEKKGLIKESKKGKKVFSAEQPQNLQNLISEQQQELALAQKQLSQLLPDITTLFQARTERPIIQVLKGVEETKILYEDVLKTKTELLIFVSRHDWDNPEMENLIKLNIKKQARKGIQIRALNPLMAGFSIEERKKYITQRKQQNITVRFLPPEYVLSSQIMVYDDKIGITSLKKELITTIIQNENIANTFRQLFDFIWVLSEDGHKKFLK
jgi:sugar-specific transcriptional regulator TrmB